MIWGISRGPITLGDMKKSAWEVISKLWSPAFCTQPFAAVFNRPSMITFPFVINLNVMRHESQAAELGATTARYV